MVVVVVAAAAAAAVVVDENNGRGTSCEIWAQVLRCQLALRLWECPLELSTLYAFLGPSYDTGPYLGYPKMVDNAADDQICLVPFTASFVPMMVPLNDLYLVFSTPADFSTMSGSQRDAF